MPDISDNTTKLDCLQKQIQAKRQTATPVSLSIVSLESVLLNKQDKTLHIARMAFPTLFPIGAVLFNSPKKRNVEMADYHCHLMHYCDDRFARHPQFCF